MAEIVRLIAATEQTMVVQSAREEDLSRHIDEVVAHVKLEVDLLVVARARLWRLPFHDDLQGVLARFKIDPDRFSGLVSVQREDLEVLGVEIVIFVGGVGLSFMAV